MASAALLVLRKISEPSRVSTPRCASKPQEAPTPVGRAQKRANKEVAGLLCPVTSAKRSRQYNLEPASACEDLFWPRQDVCERQNWVA